MKHKNKKEARKRRRSWHKIILQKQDLLINNIPSILSSAHCSFVWKANIFLFLPKALVQKSV